ncbi:MATE family efflux transporter [Streptomyces sp. A3M-1-3]|uniref:MATE family efflux transporter n=1 Tax=Streptomyces sp. A3M-1-3 TaxID=2962044 RepID=UPI0020B74B92|nr:MATE family efflux transporter [Streptomyces sp. A3M-1-3]MCP3817582.1 MATE family efflux transporter [Streptomyces sp. A3M-1-3]
MNDPERPTVRRAWTLAYPLLIAGLTQITLNIVDTVMLARLSTRALGAFALAAPVYLIALIVVRGWATAVQVLVARSHGAGRPGEVAQVVRAGIVTSIGVGAALGAVLYAVAPLALTVLGAPDDVLGPGSTYLRLMAIAVPFAAVSFTLQAACAGIGATRVSMYTALLVNLVNLPLGLLLIFHAGLGVTGAALATLAATATGTGYLLLYSRNRLPRRTEDLDNAHPSTRELWRIGWPEMSTLGIGYVNEALMAGFAARMSTHDLAAYRIVDNLTLVIFTFLASASTAITILAGQELGSGHHERAAAWQRTGAKLLLLMLALPSAAALALGRPLLSQVTTDSEVVNHAWTATPLALLSMAPLALAMSHAALLRAAGDTKTVMIASVTSDYTLLVPLGWLLGVHAGLGLPGLYLAWTAFGVLYAALLRVPYKRRFCERPANSPTLSASSTDG